MQSQSNFSTWFHLGLQFNSNRSVRVQILSQISQISHKLIFLFQTPIKSHRRTNGEKHIIAITERNTLNRLWQLCRGLHLQMCRIQVVQILLFWITGSKISQTRRISILSDSHKSVAFSRGYFLVIILLCGHRSVAHRHPSRAAVFWDLSRQRARGSCISTLNLLLIKTKTRLGGQERETRRLPLCNKHTNSVSFPRQHTQ